MNDNPNCDGSGPHTAGEVRVLPYGGGGNLILCRSCYTREMIYRARRNMDLSADCQFKRPLWTDLEIYDPR